LGSVLEEHEKGDGGCYTGKDEGEDYSDDLVVRSRWRVRDERVCGYGIRIVVSGEYDKMYWV